MIKTALKIIPFLVLDRTNKQNEKFVYIKWYSKKPEIYLNQVFQTTPSVKIAY